MFRASLDAPREEEHALVAVPDPIYLLSVVRAAAALGLGRSKFYEMVRDGQIRTVKFGRRILVHIDESRRRSSPLRRV